MAGTSLMRRPRGFLVVFSGRCGSTFLFHRLREHPQVVAPGEIFGFRAKDYPVERTAADQARFVNEFFHDYRWGARQIPKVAAGFKIQWPGPHNPQIVDTDDFVSHLKHFDLGLIRLSRENRVKQAVSRIRGELVRKVNRDQPNIVSATLDDRKREFIESKTYIDPALLRRTLTQMEGADRLITEFLVHFPNHLEFSYEELVHNKQAALDRVFEFIGVPHLVLKSEEPTIKMTSDRLRDVVENFDECSRALSRTPYEGQLET